MKKVLLATLGESPAVVTEAIDRLRADGIRIDYVVILTTKDTYAQDALDLLLGHLPDYYKNQISIWPWHISDSIYDINTDDAALEFMTQACSALRDYRKKGWDVYVCIAGGRKTMSALLALAVQFYGANMLFHVLVDDLELEEEGHILKLKNKSPDEQNRALHPDVSLTKIIRMPFIGLLPLLDDLLSGLKGHEVRSEIKALLEQNGLWQQGSPTNLGRSVLGVLESVEALPPPRQSEECEKHLAKKEPKEAQATRDWADRICRRFLFVERIEDIGWRQGQPKIKAEPPNQLVIFVPGRRISGIGFRLTTTAQTEGKLERARQEVERWIEKEVGL